jgi:hypothetical protein
MRPSCAPSCIDSAGNVAARYTAPVGRALSRTAVVAMLAMAPAAATSCGSSATSDSGGEASPPSIGAGGGGAGGSASGALPASGTITCTSAAECEPGQICCVASEGTICQQGPCGPEQDTLPAVQLCGTAAECVVKGASCASSRALPLPVDLLTADASVCATEADLVAAGLVDGSADAPTDTSVVASTNSESGGFEAGAVDGGEAQAHDG